MATKSQQALAEVQNQVEELCQVSSNLPMELSDMRKELAAEKENLNDAEEGEAHPAFSPRATPCADYGPQSWSTAESPVKCSG